MSDTKKIVFIFLVLTVMQPCFSEAERGSVPIQSFTHIAMATTFKAIVYGEDTDTDPESLRDAAQAAFQAVDALENRISNWKPGSYTSLVNKSAAKKPLKVSVDLIELLEVSRRIYNNSSGAFDVTVNPLLVFWREQEKLGIFPEPEKVKPILDHVGLNHVLVDNVANTVFFEKPGMSLDFGGIAKGLALDRMSVVLEEHGVHTALLNAGTSTLLAMGQPKDEAGWTVSINSPYNNGLDNSIANVVICNESLSTSSNAERFFDVGGKRCSHIIDPRNGMPVGGLTSATAICPTGVESDALSTAFFVMGVAEVRSYCEKHPEVRAILLEDGCPDNEAIFVNFNNERSKE
jgi:thiamine biosynthesis lipoprotein